MSTTQSLSEHSAQKPPEELLAELFNTPGICPSCFGKKREYHTEYEEAVGEHLTGRNSSAWECRGHTVSDEGTLLVDSTACSTPDPSTFYEVVPPTVIDGVRKPARAQNVCECGVVDYDPDEARSNSMLYTAVENIAERLDGLDVERMEVFVYRAIERGRPCGDKRILARAIEFGRTE